jgi:hypothetical protein
MCVEVMGNSKSTDELFIRFFARQARRKEKKSKDMSRKQCGPLGAKHDKQVIYWQYERMYQMRSGILCNGAFLAFQIMRWLRSKEWSPAFARN